MPRCRARSRGCYGGKILADYAKAQGWNVIANLNNDIIGNSCGSDGVCNDKAVRVFSEGPRWQGHEELAAQHPQPRRRERLARRATSRASSTALAERLPPIGLDVMQIWRNDRFGRGGDHTEFLNAGFPAVRLSVAVENYDYQHQDLRVEKGVEYGDTIDKMDFPYLAKVTKLNVAALAALASAPPPPEPTVEGAVSTDTTVNWSRLPARRAIIVRWRRTDADQLAEHVRRQCRRMLVADRCAPMHRHANVRRHGSSSCDVSSKASASTIGCSACRRSARTASKARSLRRCRAGRSSRTCRRRRSDRHCERSKHPVQRWCMDCRGASRLAMTSWR